MVVLVTTLLNPVVYPAQDILMLYVKCWDIELRFRDIKTTIGMEIFHVKKPRDGARNSQNDGDRLQSHAHHRTKRSCGSVQTIGRNELQGLPGCGVTSLQVIFAGPWWHVTKYQKMVDEVVLICADKLNLRILPAPNT